VPDFKDDDKALLQWYKVQLGKLPVSIRLNFSADREFIEKSNADIVIIATGSSPIKLDLGSKNHVCMAENVLSGSEKAGQNVLIIGGGLVGCELGLWLRQQGKNITIVEAKPDILGGGKNMCFANYDMLKDLLAFHQIRVLRDTLVKAVNDTSVTLETPEGVKEADADTVIISVGYRPCSELYNSLRDSSKLVYNVGDSRDVRDIRNAIWDAYLLAREL
jgi:2-enoate reductase